MVSSEQVSERSKFKRVCLIFLGVGGPGVVPMDAGQHSVQNRGSVASGAPTATPFVKKTFPEKAIKKHV